MLFSDLPYVKLADWTTPLQRLERFGALVGHGQLYIKRDDLTGIGMGGNKVRNLEFLLGEAMQQNADVILVAGGLQSNLCRLTAAACVRVGLECIIVHNADRPAVPEGNQLLNHLMGTKALYLGPMDEVARGQKVREIAEQLHQQGRRPYIIDSNTPVATLGYTKAALELHEQAVQTGVDLKHIALVGAMAGTATGFLYGTALLGHPFHVHLISVEYPRDQLRQIITDIWDGVVKLTGVRPPTDLDQVVTIYYTYLGQGYGIPTPEAVQSIYDLARTEAIFIENVYTSKTLYGMVDLIRKGIIPRDEAACFIHTGGLPALFTQSDLFRSGARH
ncbi:MAG: pyridoxal-phosphate dependent enzyme [Bacillota bacterium]